MENRTNWYQHWKEVRSELNEALREQHRLEGELSVSRSHVRRLKERLAVEVATRAELELLAREAGLLPVIVRCENGN